MEFIGLSYLRQVFVDMVKPTRENNSPPYALNIFNDTFLILLALFLYQ